MPKDVNAAVATIKTKRTIQFVDAGRDDVFCCAPNPEAEPEILRSPISRAVNTMLQASGSLKPIVR